MVPFHGFYWEVPVRKLKLDHVFINIKLSFYEWTAHSLTGEQVQTQLSRVFINTEVKIIRHACLNTDWKLAQTNMKWNHELFRHPLV